MFKSFILMCINGLASNAADSYLLTSCIATVLLYSLCLEATDSIKQTVLCLHDKSINTISLGCLENEAIIVEESYYGYQELSSDLISCTYQKEDPCNETIQELDSILRKYCFGQAKCHFNADKIYLKKCQIHSNYLQLKYKCLAQSSEQYIDICTDYSGIHTSGGYIHTPYYPAHYPSDLTCVCNITSTVEHANISLVLMDAEFETDPTTQHCKYDGISVNSADKLWSPSNSICHSDFYHPLYYDSSAYIIFRADGYGEQRGALLNYTAYIELTEVPLHIECSSVNPIVTRHETLCTHNISEVLVSCHDIGTINILGAHHGYTSNQSADDCGLITDIRCQEEAFNMADIFSKCMGDDVCVITVLNIPVPPCNSNSNYFQIDYQCVPTIYDPDYIVDVCGDSLTKGSTRHRYGYIQSPNYPGIYPHDTRCMCHLEVEEHDATVYFKLLDLHLPQREDKELKCSSDWVAFRGMNQSWGMGEKLCYESLGSWIHTSLHQVYVDFSSNSEDELRGFWLEYSGRNSQGNIAPVRVSCYQVNDQHSEKTITTQPFVVFQNGDGQSTNKHVYNKGLISALVIIIALVLIVGFLMVIYKLRKVNIPRMSQSPGQSTPLDTSYDVLKKYSSIASSNIPDVNYILKESDGQFLSTTATDTTRSPKKGAAELVVTLTQGGPPPIVNSSYTNPVFEDTNCSSAYPAV